MKIGKMSLAWAGLFAVVCFGADVYIGTWRLNDSKSKNVPAAQKTTTMVIAAAGDSVKVSIDAIDEKGKPTHEEWTGKFDSKDYPLTGDTDTDTLAYKRINDHTLELTEKKGGKIVETGRVVYSADGKTRTVTETTTDANGKKTSFTSVYDKQ